MLSWYNFKLIKIKVTRFQLMTLIKIISLSLQSFFNYLILWSLSLIINKIKNNNNNNNNNNNIINKAITWILRNTNLF